MNIEENLARDPSKQKVPSQILNASFRGAFVDSVQLATLAAIVVPAVSISALLPSKGWLFAAKALTGLSLASLTYRSTLNTLQTLGERGYFQAVSDTIDSWTTKESQGQ